MVIVCAGTARGDGLDGERFVPAIGAEGGFVLEPPSVPAHLGWGLGLFMNLADNQVVQRTGGMIDTRPLDTAFSTDLLASLGLFNRLELGVGLPLHLVYDGDTYTTGGTTLAASSGVGDLRFMPKVAIVRAGGVATHYVLSLAVPTTFPTGNEAALRGQGGYSIEPRLLFGVYLGRIGLSFDAGYRWRSEHSPTLPWGDEITLGGGLAFAATNRLTLRAEIYAEKEVNAMVGGADFPFELLGGLDYAIKNWDLYAGATFGVTDGIGDPRVRIVAGVRYRHNVPSNEGFRDSDGDGILDKDDRCPNEAEDKDGFEDADGCPELDNDGDGIPDEEDECPELAGDAAHHGCPAKTFVRIEEGRIYIFGKVQFQTGSHHIDHASDPLLDQIAQALNANPQVKHIRIDGHTDNVGGTGMNQRLSEERAASVKEALEKRGVDGGRLSTRGYGESQPVAPNGSPAGRAKNRRVEFIIAERQR
jgi:outer membrane protein OmpA-like peptidoglycan-associated protein